MDETPIRDYIWHGDVPVAQIDGNTVVDTISYIHTDHLNTPRLATNTSGSVIWRWEGNAFGSTAAQEFSGEVINLRFPGQYFDSET